MALVEALSRRLPELIADARELCNYVVIDTAPIGEISDALRLVSDVDSIIVVTKPGNTNRANFEMMRDLLERTAYTPAGFLVIGDSTPRTSAYYAYGATGRELFLAGPRAGRRAHAAAPGAHEVRRARSSRTAPSERAPPPTREPRRRPDRAAPRAIERESTRAAKRARHAGPRRARTPADAKRPADAAASGRRTTQAPATSDAEARQGRRRPSGRPTTASAAPRRDGEQQRRGRQPTPLRARRRRDRRRGRRPPRAGAPPPHAPAALRGAQPRADKPSRSEDRPSKN